MKANLRLPLHWPSSSSRYMLGQGDRKVANASIPSVQMSWQMMRVGRKCSGICGGAIHWLGCCQWRQYRWWRCKKGAAAVTADGADADTALLPIDDHRTHVQLTLLTAHFSHAQLITSTSSLHTAHMHSSTHTMLTLLTVHSCHCTHTAHGTLINIARIV